MTTAIGLTGGVASGKTTVAEAFQRLGAPVADADAIARAVVEPGQPALAEIVDVFGREILDASGALDRAALRRRVFGDDALRRRLEGIIHPRVREELENARRQTRAPYIVLVVPLLVEGGQHRAMDRVLVVDVPEETQIDRLIQRDGIDRDLARRMLASQAGREQRLACADDVLANTGGVDIVAGAVQRLHEAYLKLATDGPRSVGPLRVP